MKRRVYGAKREFKADIVQSVEESNPNQVTDAAFIVANYKGNEPMIWSTNTGHTR